MCQRSYLVIHTFAKLTRSWYKESLAAAREVCTVRGVPFVWDASLPCFAVTSLSVVRGLRWAWRSNSPHWG